MKLAVVLLVGGLVISGCTGTSGASSGDQQSPPPPPPPPKPASLVLTPGDGADAVAPGEPVTAAVTDGKIVDAKLTGADGKVVAGAPKPDGSGWQAAEPLGYGKKYTLTANAIGADGKPVAMTSNFSTANPARQTSVSLNLTDGATVGVGMPIVFTFGYNVRDKPAAERALRIITEPQTEGAFHWFSDQSVTWRPREYWKPGTKVTVEAAIYGKHLGNGTYGQEDQRATVTIGDKLVALADGDAHQMKVMVNDQEVKTMPISMGKRGSTTPVGTYTVMSEHIGFTMDSSTYGVPTNSPAGYRTWVQYATRMSNSGIFYHSAPWSVGQQGNSNVSHGCINLSTENAKWLMDTSKPGDIITVQGGGGPPLEPTDGWSVWQMSWQDWQSGGQRN